MSARAATRHTRPLLGLRRKPGRLALAVFRMPLRADRTTPGGCSGRTFLEFVHVGRTSGRQYETVAMVLHYQPATREAVICAAWGPDTDWVRNLRAAAATRVRLGRDSFTPQHRFLTEDESFVVAEAFRRAHPWRLRLLSSLLGWGDLRDDAAVREFIRTTRSWRSGRPPIPRRPERSNRGRSLRQAARATRDVACGAMPGRIAIIGSLRRGGGPRDSGSASGSAAPRRAERHDVRGEERGESALSSPVRTSPLPVQQEQFGP